MKNKILRLIACLLAMAMMITMSASLIADEDIDTDSSTTQGEVAGDLAETDETEPDENGDSAETEDVDSNQGDVIGQDETDNAEVATGDEDDVTDGNTLVDDPDEFVENDENATADDSTEEAASEEEEEVVAVLTDAEAIARCTVAAENDNFILYLDEEYERIGLYVKESGYVHWSNCVNALSDQATSKEALRKNRLSSLAYKYGNVTDLVVSTTYYYSYRESTAKEKTNFEIVDNGVKVTYTLNTAKATVPVYYILEDDYLDVYIKTKEIKEKAGYKETEEEDLESSSDVIVITDIVLNPYMSAATTEDNGYMLIPDGSGALIELNNGKGNYANYSQSIYGRDITAVKENAPDETEQAYLPVMAMVKGNNGLVMIATDGDTFATANAAVSGSKADQSSYNYCYFSFTLRSTDNYYMTGDQSSIIVFEKGDGTILVDKIAVRYYPITSESETVALGEIADVYRNYLIEEEGLTVKTEENKAPLYIDYFGGTLKSKSILGIPVNVKTAFTSFAEAIVITDALNDAGVSDMVINYNDWTNDSMTGKIDTAKKVASCVGGKSDFRKFQDYLTDKGYEGYFSITGYTFSSSGNGFTTLFNTAYRVSKSYARPYTYNIAFGTPNGGVADALLSPKSISKLSDKVTKNLSKLNISGAGLGEISSSLWSDFSTKNRTNRATTAQSIIDYYKSVREATGSIIADAPNAYLLAYVDQINNLTLQSSRFKIVDQDVPFYQMVVHGYIPYTTEALNASADSTTLFLKAIAAGSNIHFDFIHEETSKLVNSGYMYLYYANYEGWIEYAGQTYSLANEILSKVSNAVITDYKVDGDVITTSYDNGIVTTVNLETGVITCDGKTYVYSDYVQEGGAR